MLRSRSVRPLLNPSSTGRGAGRPGALERDVGVLLGEPLLYPPRVGHACASPSMSVTSSWVGSSRRSAAAGCTPRVVGDGDDAVARDPDEVTLVDLAGIGERVPHRPGDLGGTTRAATRSWRPRSHRLRLRVVGEEGGEPLDDGAGRDHPHGLGAQGVDLFGHRTDVLVVGRITTSSEGTASTALTRSAVAGSSSGRRRPGGGRRASGRCGDPVARDHGDDPRGRHRAHALDAGPRSGRAGRSRTQRSSSTCSSRSVTRMRSGFPASTPASTAAPMSLVWMWQFHSPSPPTTTMESPMPAHTSLKASMESSGADSRYITS